MMHPVAATVRVALLALVAPAALAATFAGVEVPPPLPPQAVSEMHWGTSVADPYRFVENTADPAVQRWMRAQAGATREILDRIPGRAALLARIREIDDGASGVVTSIARTDGGRYFFLRREPGESQFRLVWRDGADGSDTVAIDPHVLTKATGVTHAILDFAPSPDGRKLAYAVQKGGSEIGTLHVIDVDTGRELVAPIDRIRYAGVAWLDDGSGFFYNRLREGYEKLPPTERFGDSARRFRALDAAGTDRVVMSASHNPELAWPIYATPHVAPVRGTRTALAFVSLGVDRHRLAYVADLDAAIRGNAKWRRVAGVDDKVIGATANGRWLYLRTSKGAPRYKVVRVPLDKPDIASAETVIPESEGVLTAIGASRDALYAIRREGTILRLLRVAHAPGSPVEPVALPFEGRVRIDDADPLLDGVVIDLGGWTRTAKPYLYPGSGSRLAELRFAKQGRFDAPEGIEVREVRFRSHDGTEVPLSILSRKGLALDGSSPAILYGYGAYGTTEDPGFNPRILAWLERGGVYAIAHVRGGGAFGEAWHTAGRKATKPNTWKDAIAAAEWLIANGYTAKSRLAIAGGSAGGILVGRAITERPDLFAAAVPSVGSFDKIRSETSANGVANIPEFGTVKDEGEFRALLAMSSYHQIRDGVAYPGVLVVHGANDIRVDVWQSVKFANRLMRATAGGRPVLLRLDFDSGHGQGSSREQLQARTADSWSFVLWQAGVPEFQPKAPAEAPRT
jgi:prolyl oligopeptidase